MKTFNVWLVEREGITSDRMLDMLVSHFGLPVNPKTPATVPLEDLDLKFLEKKIKSLASDMVTDAGKKAALEILMMPGNKTLGDLARVMSMPPFRPDHDTPSVDGTPGGGE